MVKMPIRVLWLTIEAMSSCLVNTVQLTTNADRQLLIAFVINCKIMDLLVYLIGVLVAFFIGYLIGNKQLE